MVMAMVFFKEEEGHTMIVTTTKESWVCSFCYPTKSEACVLYWYGKGMRKNHIHECSC